jgi:phage regulator Rha-like protein
VILKGERRGQYSKYRPYAFTQEGIAMLSSVLRSKRAVQVNIAIMRTFVKLRELMTSHRELAQKINALERRYDAQFKVVFQSIRELIEAKPKELTRIPSKKHPLGFGRE